MAPFFAIQAKQTYVAEQLPVERYNFITMVLKSNWVIQYIKIFQHIFLWSLAIGGSQPGAIWCICH